MSATVITLGVFDGFHVGHRAVIRRARETADAAGAGLTAFTFDTPPRAVLGGHAPGLLLASLAEKVASLRGAGVDEARVLRFDRHLAGKDARRFLIEHVFGFTRLAGVVVGYDFAFGRGRTGTVAFLSTLGREAGFSVEPVEAVLEGGVPISSSRIREALTGGDVEEAARWLGRFYRVPGRVGRGDGRGRTLGYPTANLTLDADRLRPGRGVYAVRVDGAGMGTVPGVANIGERPTFGGGEERVEVHLLAPAGDLVGTALGVTFVARLRDERKFNNSKELQDQIALDVAAAGRRLDPGNPAPSAFP